MGVMKPCVKQIVVGLMLAFIAGGIGYSQGKDEANSPSLGDIARELKVQKSKDSKPAKVFTNDNLDIPEADASTLESPAKAEKSPTPPPHETGPHQAAPDAKE